MSAVPSALPSSTMMISKSGVRSEAVLTVRITMLAMVPLSLYAGKKTLSPEGLPAGGADIKKALNHSTEYLGRDEAPRRERRFEHDARRHLRFALAPLDERDRHFGDPRAESVRDVEHLDEKRIAVRREAIEWE